ncbi:PrsW family intramembrane metalloprotease [Haloarcula pelagica]|uniref:PrsW family intramembrane metalloprotease n=1 Tax=Haloarcula pelagica TaxID=3033389 RepID=UPI0024C42378|nr:PrsW family intramembrane metalloprotease [Halomicroarcula sp. YJ-61-S]
MHPRKLLRIAKWEVTKNAGGVDKRTIVVMALAILAMGVVAATAVGGGGAAALDQGIYRVGVEQSSPYYAVAASDSTFQVREPAPGEMARNRQELWFEGTTLQNTPRTPKQRAALAEFGESTERYNDARLGRDDNRTAAFPVTVTLRYAEQDGPSLVDPRTGEGASGDGAADGDGAAGGGTTGGDGDGASDGGSGDGASGRDGTASGGGGANLGSLGARLSGDVEGGTPGDISPPFPFESLVLAFLYIVPMNFVIQAYGSSMLSERLNRRGELLLVTPASRADIVGGKTLPYLLGAVGVAGVITAALRLTGIAPSGSPIAVLAVAPVALLFLSATFLGAMFARSFKELTFVTVTITVTLTSYAFVPAIFTDVTPIALISPLTLVVMDLTGQSISLAEFVFSTTPPLLTALLLFGLGAGLYREEDMFTQRPIPLKVLDTLSGRIKSRRSAFKITVILLPLVIVAELVAIAFLFVLDSVSLNVFGTNQTLGIVLILVVVAVVEELAKSLHVYAGYTNADYEATLRSALGLGFLSGLGFFVAEKGLLIARLANLDTLPIGQAALQGASAPADVPLWLAGVLLFLPLALHTVTAAISSVGALRGRRGYLLGIGAAIAVHFAYNFTVVSAYV